MTPFVVTTKMSKFSIEENGDMILNGILLANDKEIAQAIKKACENYKTHTNENHKS